MSHQNHHDHAHSHAHDHDHSCCGHAHGHGHSHAPQGGLGKRWLVSLVVVAALLVVLRPFIISQMLVRVTSYSANASYHEAVRMSLKVIALDPGNQQAWTALGFAYMDLSQTDAAIRAFENVLKLDPQNRGAACFELGEAYLAKGNCERAIGHFEWIRAAGPMAGAQLDADMLKYRHGRIGFQSVNSMEKLLNDLAKAYKIAGVRQRAEEIEHEYEVYKGQHSKIFF